MQSYNNITSGLPTTYGKFNEWSSIYIPRVHINMTRQELVNIIENDLHIGQVLHIDFALLKRKSGLKQRPKKMAFIHMAAFYDTHMTYTVRYEMEVNGFWEVPDIYHKYPSIKIRFVINKNPITRTKYTMETLTDRLAQQHYMIEQQAVTIKLLEEKIETLCALQVKDREQIIRSEEDLIDNCQDIRFNLQQTHQRISDIEIETYREICDTEFKTNERIHNIELRFERLEDRFALQYGWENI